MTVWYRAAAVTAQDDWFQRVWLRSNSDPRSVLAMCALLAAVIVGVWIASRFFQVRERQRTHCPRALFRELCHAHGLSSNERNLLLRLASQQDAYNPAAVFLEPQNFDIDHLPPAAVGDAEAVKRLWQQLFGPIGGTADTTRHF
jgi:hypothetical protein